MDQDRTKSHRVESETSVVHSASGIPKSRENVSTSQDVSAPLGCTLECLIVLCHLSSLAAVHISCPQPTVRWFSGPIRGIHFECLLGRTGLPTPDQCHDRDRVSRALIGDVSVDASQVHSSSAQCYVPNVGTMFDV